MTHPLRTLLSLSLLAASAAQAGPAISCDRMEYARLKDTSRKDLTDAYCSDMRTSKLNADLRAIRDAADPTLETRRRADEREKEVSELNAAQMTCVRAAEDAANMLSKKFKAARPTCPN